MWLHWASPMTPVWVYMKKPRQLAS